MTLDHQQKLDNIADELFYYVNEVWVIKDLFKNILGEVSVSSPYLNFRDALFHFNKMYDAAKKNDDYNFAQQYACIEEHLNRGLKDFTIYLCANYYTRILNKMIHSTAPSINNDTLPVLRRIYHGLKNIVVDIRLGGQFIQRFDSHNNKWLSDVVGTIGDFHIMLDKDRALVSLYKRFAVGVSKEIIKGKFI